MSACLVLWPLSTPGAAFEPPPRSPEIAAGIAIGAPIGLMALGRLSPEPAMVFALPALGLGLGHVYAGRPARGAAVLVASTVTGVGAFNLVRSIHPDAFQAGVFVGTLVALGLAAGDAYTTTHEAGQEE